MHSHARLFGAVEAGGTKFVCAVADESGAIHAEARFATADPDSTLAQVRELFQDGAARFCAERDWRGLLRPDHSAA